MSRAVRDYAHFAYSAVQRGVRDARWKLIEYMVEGVRTTQLFDLWQDPHEMNNLAAAPDAQEHLRRLRQALCRWRSELADEEGPQGAAYWQAYDAAG